MIARSRGALREKMRFSITKRDGTLNLDIIGAGEINSIPVTKDDIDELRSLAANFEGYEEEYSGPYHIGKTMTETIVSINYVNIVEEDDTKSFYTTIDIYFPSTGKTIILDQNDSDDLLDFIYSVILILEN